MVKFSKQLEVQLVPEWKSAFCDYWQLKKDLKRVKMYLNNSSSANTSNGSNGIGRGGLKGGAHCSSPLPFANTLTRRMSSWTQLDSIMVHQHKTSAASMNDIYETELLNPLEGDDNETERAFFASLDAQLNKVNQFYVAKEQEYMERLDSLVKQLHNLINMQKESFSHHDSQRSFSRRFLASIMIEPHASSSNSLSTPFSHLQDIGGEKSRIRSENGGKEDSPTYEEGGLRNIEELKEEELEGQMKLMYATSDQNDGLGLDEEQLFGGYNNNNNNNNNNLVETQKCDWEGDQKEYVKKRSCRKKSSSTSTTTTTTTTTSSLSVSHNLWSSKENPLPRNNNISFNHEVTRAKIRYSKKLLRTAFVEFYRGLGLLRSFSSLNLLAIAKILKKYDKITRRKASPAYLKVVEGAHFNTSDKIIRMMDETERLFTEHFTETDHKKAMMLLRPPQQKPSHAITFFLGLFTGCSIAILVALIILLHLRVLYSESPPDYILEHFIKSAYPIFSLLFLILLHMYLYGWNVYAWRKVRINYAFIFEFAPKTELRNREILLVCTCLTTFGMACLLAHLVALFKASALFNPELIPLSLLMVLFFILFCPFNICYRSSRLFFLQSMKRIFISPFYKVVFADFFLADQLTSQIASLRCLQYIMCYYFGGHFMRHDNNVCNDVNFHYWTYLFSFLPYWWRLLQCIRRYMEEGDHTHLANGGKYLSAMIAAGARLTFSYVPTQGWLTVFVLASGMATMYQLYWDIIMDWGLLQFHSKNPFLRDNLILKRKYIYFFSMGLNVALRFAWLQSVIHVRLGASVVESHFADLFFASLEVIRRGHWNFYRLENEHLNNVGKYRAVKMVPLPFRDDEYEGVEV